MCTTFIGDLIDLLAAFLGPCSRVAEVFEHCERRVDRSRARRVHAAEALLDFLDDLVTVPRLLVEQAQNHKLQMALVEHSATTEWSAAGFAAARPKGAQVKPKVLRPRPERPSEPRPTVSSLHCFTLSNWT